MMMDDYKIPVGGVQRDENYWTGKFVEKVGEERANVYLTEFEKLKATPKGYREEIVNGRKRKIDVVAGDADVLFQTLIHKENCSERIMKSVFRIGSQRFARLKNGVARKAPGGLKNLFSKKQVENFFSFVSMQSVSVKICSCPARIMKAYLHEDITWDDMAIRFTQYCESVGSHAVPPELFMRYKNRYFPQLFLKKQFGEECTDNSCGCTVGRIGGSSLKDLLVTAWSFVNSAVKHTDPATLKEILNEIGVTEGHELQFCSVEDIDRLAALMKPVPKKAFLQAIKSIRSAT